MSISDAAKGRFGVFSGKQKFGAARHEFLADWNGVRMALQNDRGWISKDDYESETRNKDLDAILHQSLTEDLSSKIRAAVPTGLVSTDWTMAYILMEAKTTRSLLVDPASQLKLLAESIANDRPLKVMYLKEFKMLAFKAVLTSAWTGWLGGNTTTHGIEDWNLGKVAVIPSEASQAATSSGAVVAKATPLNKSLMVAALAHIDAEDVSESERLLDVVANFQMLANQRCQAVAGLIEPVLADTYVRAGIAAMLEYPEFGTEVMTKIKALEVDLRNFVLACYPAEADRVVVESAYEAGGLPLVVKIQSDLLGAKRSGPQDHQRSGGVAGALGQVPGTDHYSGCHACKSPLHLERDCPTKGGTSSTQYQVSKKKAKSHAKTFKRKWEEAAVVAALRKTAKAAAEAAQSAPAGATQSAAREESAPVIGSATFIAPSQE